MKTTIFTTLLMLLTTSLAFAAPVQLPKTGQTTCYDASGNVIDCAGTGQDGDKQKGAAWDAAIRFTDNADGTITDNLTGLIWLKNANCFQRNWATALTSANTLATGACGLDDGSIAGDWRLPNIVELESLIDVERSSPALPDGHPFTGVNSGRYWSSSNPPNNSWNARYVSMYDGSISGGSKIESLYAWPVRAGQ